MGKVSKRNELRDREFFSVLKSRLTQTKSQIEPRTYPDLFVQGEFFFLLSRLNDGKWTDECESGNSYFKGGIYLGAFHPQSLNFLFKIISVRFHLIQKCHHRIIVRAPINLREFFSRFLK